MKHILLVFSSWRMAAVFFTGIASGLPLALTGSTLQAWMVDEKVDLTVIGIFSLVSLPYTMKFLWSPGLDRFDAPLLGRLGKRRGWMFGFQLALAATIAFMGTLSPASMPVAVAAMAVALAFFSASQDIVIDAYKIEILNASEQGAGAAVSFAGYRLAMLFSGAVALFLADHIPWRAVYAIMGVVMALFAVLTVLAPQPKEETKLKSIKEAVVEPFVEFFSRRGAIEILVFILLYKLDVQLTLAMNTPFFLELGFTKTEIAAAMKLFGFIATIVGGITAGALLSRMTLYRALLWFGGAQAMAGLCYAALAYTGKHYGLMTLAVFIEHFCSGLGNTAFIAFVISVTNRRYTATQYALLSSFMALSRNFAGAPSGWLAKTVGWETYFVICTLVGIPGLIMLMARYKRWPRADTAQ